MKKSKKIWALFLAAVLIFTVVGCSSNETAGGDDTTTGTEDFKVGVIHIGDPAEGAGYTFAHDQGIVQMQQALGLSDAQIIRKNNIADGDAVATRTAIEECIEEGSKIIFGTSWGYMDTMEEMAEEYPDIVFSHASGYKSNGKNFNNYFGRIYEARYLSGVAAGLKTETNKIGYVAAMGQDNSEVTGGINAFAMGVESVNPDAKIYVKVTNTWFDPTLEGQAAEALLDLGADVITQHQDTTAPQLAAQSRGVWSVGYNSDMTKDAPKAHLTAPIWNWGVYYTQAAKAVMEGTWTAENYFGGMAEGMVDISPLSENCAEGTGEKIDEAKAKIVDGSFKVFEGELYDNQGNKVCEEGQVLTDGEITGAMNWYYRNVIVE
ncbi:BMP family ABC transporter substrate-binding protein [Clostridium formicaceticum]|uniref:BMP family ABC transporter substrate-binding protein n=1 Tax=Clostridium formicaceticum TaxID=1497 RepID=A0AAC9RR82_9CLOT|nr:BMP family ABC transporter substrate-binding protein [Clostridium formicaceticum]AOY74966.1 BMP family ABC transporter substrate-binding protein [Clostridium formicaceticum]ARE89378.1 Purine-binding protein precursor [Clostridium formicaceticum]